MWKGGVWQAGSRAVACGKQGDKTPMLFATQNEEEKEGDWGCIVSFDDLRPAMCYLQRIENFLLKIS